MVHFLLKRCLVLTVAHRLKGGSSQVFYMKQRFKSHLKINPDTFGKQQSPKCRCLWWQQVGNAKAIQWKWAAIIKASIFQDRFHPLSRVAVVDLRHLQRNDKTFNGTEFTLNNTCCTEHTSVRGANGLQDVMWTASLLMNLVTRRMHGRTVELTLTSISS